MTVEGIAFEPARVGAVTTGREQASVPRAAITQEDRPGRRRGWLIRRMLVLADVTGLTLAFAATLLLFPSGSLPAEWIFLATLPGWITIARLYHLYDQDEERTHHPTTDDFAGVFHLVTIGTWVFFCSVWLLGLANPSVPKVMTLWASAVVFVTLARTVARALCRRSPAYLQNTLILGAGSIGQQAARKVIRHPEYGLKLLGFVDADPKPRADGLEGVHLLGTPDELPDLVRRLHVERVIVAFSNESDEATIAAVRSLNDLDVQVDVIPRLFELVSPSVQVDTLEGLPIVELPPVRLSRSSRLMKRAVDIIASTVGLIALAPLFLYIALRVKIDSPGPIFFRQTRLGRNERPFTALKFRTMKVDTDQETHRAYIESTMSSEDGPRGNGLYKLERDDAITRSGHWLRRTSLDELPQLINVFRGDMSLVGPRPCIPYETEFFEPHHFDRFLVPAGITGLWQVTARAQSTFGEALDMDVAYARGWSLGLDVRLLCRTPLQVLARRGAA